jgi:hypothetical protein
VRSCLGSRHKLILHLHSGNPDVNDAIGDGVLRQVIACALKLCLDEAHCQVVNEDGYVSLRLSSFPTDIRLDALFTLGVLCTMYLIKIQNGPNPVSPILLEAAINGLESIIDMHWLTVVVPDISQTLALFPISHDQQFLTDIQDLHRLRLMVASRMDTTVSHFTTLFLH